MPKIRSLALLVVLASSVLGCRPDQPTSPPPDEGPAAPIRPSVELEGMVESIEWLAADERQGRFTLDPQIEEVAGWIAARHEQLGLEPVDGAEALRVPYSLRTNVAAGEGSVLRVERGGERVEVGAEYFTPRAEGISGTVTGELVFAGYGVSWTHTEDENPEPGAEAPPKPIVDSYDDFAGLELDGKIALVLAHAPNTPDLMALFAAMQKLAEDFEVAAAPLREADNTRKLKAMHRKAREDLADLVAPFIDTEDLGDAYWKVDDPKAPLDIMRLAGVFTKRTANRPQFDPRELSHAAKVARLAEAGATGVVIVQGPRSFIGKQARDDDELPGANAGSGRLTNARVRVLPEPTAIPVVQLSWKQADALFSIGGHKLSKVQAAIDADYQPRSQALGVELELGSVLAEERVEVPNVLAKLPGKTDEIVLLGAHFDHIGNDETGNCRAIVRRDTRDAICNGADDNASGTAMLLELARAYRATGVTPERTIVFAHFSGEELGLLGSRALFDNSPFDQGRVVAMVNLDMVGRLGPQGLQIGGIGSSDDWMPLLDELGNHGMEVLYERSTTARSDHAHWFRAQTPVLFFFTGLHGDYHRAGDELDELELDGLANIGALVGDLIWELAAGRSIAWTPPRDGDGIGRALPGSDPATIIKRVAEDGTLIED